MTVMTPWEPGPLGQGRQGRRRASNDTGGADDEGEDQEGTVFIVVDYYVSDVNSFQIQIIANRMGSEQFTNHLFIVSYLNTKTGFRNSRRKCVMNLFCGMNHR